MNMARDPIKILIVDDDQDVLIELERLLESEGYSTATAWSGQEALALSEKDDFDPLLIDEHLADIDAHALFEELVSGQPHAFRFLMHTRRETPDGEGDAVCKWDHADVKAKIRNRLAA
jgi:CheY-like chemotaxis protein